MFVRGIHDTKIKIIHQLIKELPKSKFEINRFEFDLNLLRFRNQFFDVLYHFAGNCPTEKYLFKFFQTTLKVNQIWIVITLFWLI